MIYSRSVEYAIRALTHLATKPAGSQQMARRIADEEGLPVFFLAKTLQQLARKGVLRSTKGPTGGFVLNRPASRINLREVVETLDGPEALRRWPKDRFFQPVRRELMRYLTKTTIADLASVPARRRRPNASKKRSARRR